MIDEWQQTSKFPLAIAVGSSSEKICSIGSFARAEAEAFRLEKKETILIEPDGYGFLENLNSTDFSSILLHAPSLHDRRRPWNVLLSLKRLRRLKPDASIILTLHEYAEAPFHWKWRARLAAYLSDAIIVNSEIDFRCVSKWGRPVLQVPLGPTIWNSRLLTTPDKETLRSEKHAAKLRLIAKKCPGFDTSREPVILSAGLISPGKGLEKLLEFLRSDKRKLPLNAKFVLMGGFGPKSRDLDFKTLIVSEFKELLGNNFYYISEPPDSIFADALISADLVLMPYENGVSERRSSFLSSCASGAEILTTVGILSQPLQLERSGAWTLPTNCSALDFLELVQKIFKNQNENPSDSEIRRLKNVSWAQDRSWRNRILKEKDFIEKLQVSKR